MCLVAVSALPLLLLGCPGEEEEEAGEGEGEAAGEGEGEPAGEGEGEPAGEGEGEPAGEGEGEQNIVEIVVASDDFDTLEAAVVAAGLADDLGGPGPFTVFAPTDAAFEALPEGLLETLLETPTDLLAEVLQYHVVAGRVTAAQVVGLTEADSLLGPKINIQVDAGTVVLNGRVQVVTTDIQASNGIIHVIDAVLLPADFTFPGSIADVVAASPRFSTLLTAVGAAAPAIASTLSGDGTFTLFAPTNNAFDTVPPAALADLLADQAGLTNVLLNHVLGMTVLSPAVMDGLEAQTLLAGSSLAFDVSPEGVFIGDVEVTAFDIKAENGVIHVIDGVLLPAAE
jgi:uncharacterized surface protein with fasciclin (FAS1) repeats